MKRQDTHYQVLGVEPNVTAAEIKRAYRQLVKDCHPDLEHNGGNEERRGEATKRMMRLNEAYETLKDRARRQAYDTFLGLSRRPRNLPPGGIFVDEDEARERYLKQVFHPSRQDILRLLNMYERQLKKLSEDIYDDRLVEAFEAYSDRVEAALRKGSEALSRNEAPRSLEGAITMMRLSIAQAVDGLEEMRRFCQNYDYDHLSMAGNLFRISTDLSRQALALTRV